MKALSKLCFGCVYLSVCLSASLFLWMFVITPEKDFAIIIREIILKALSKLCFGCVYLSVCLSASLSLWVFVITPKVINRFLELSRTHKRLLHKHKFDKI